MPVHGTNVRHRRSAPVRRGAHVPPRRSSPIFARSTADNSLVLGPGGEAAIIPTQAASVTSASTPEEGDPQSQANKVAQTGLLLSTEVVAVMGPNTAQVSSPYRR